MAVKIEKKNNSGERVDLFEIDGKVYDIPANPRANVALKFLKNVRTMGEDFAAGVMLEDLLGSDNYDVLTNCDDLGLEDLQEIIGAAQAVLLGALEKAGKDQK